jgi:hypothetical protein
MPSLFEYHKQVTRFLREAKQELLSPEDLTDYINRARREVAMRAMCLRRLTPITGSIVSWTVTDGGTGYSGTPTLIITAPDFPSGMLPYPNGLQAEALPIIVGGVIQGITSSVGGYGYWQPQMQIVDTTGSGATAVPVMSFINQLNAGQEEYSFSSVDMSMFPGVGSVYMIKSVAIIYSNYRYVLPIYDFTTYQARIRNYPFQYQYVPTFACQRGQGADGTFMMYPLPSQQYQMEWDCFCLPEALVDDNSVEALNYPWTDAIPYFAACLCYEELQNLNAATYYQEKFDKLLQRYSNYARPGHVTNPYGRY